ncbi:MAG: phenylalanine--tRNA ligase subunit beta [bacterium]|nr:phenylalanine--tRNA ligase subunit beta [bacterium]
MKLPLTWLKDFVTVRTSPEKLAQLLTLSGSEVEQIIPSTALGTSRGPEVSGIIVGLVEEVKQHPNADRLKVCLVRVLASEQPRTIVCGAPNVAAGQKVPVALPGTVLPNGVELRAATIRGVESSGMICAADELALGDDHSGIIVLDPKAEVGTPAAKWLGAADITLDVKVTPNRGDCLSIRGLAREVAILTKQKLKEPAPARHASQGVAGGPKLVEGKSKNTVQVKVQDTKSCSQYVARLVEGITIKSSPVEVQERLASVGIRPINAVVDATNYVMLELGQPLHAFDADKLNQIVVRSAKPNEQLVTLDGEKRNLLTSDLVIADKQRAIAIAGVMGGQDTEVSEHTKRVIIESARFDPIRVRLTAQRLHLRSEASNRFEKGIDPALAIEAADRCAAYIAAWADGVVAKGRVVAGKKPLVSKVITLTLAEVERLIGARVPAAKMKAMLTSLGCKVQATKTALRVVPPSWRLDLIIPADLVEEVGRLMDYNTLKPTLPHIPQRAPEQSSSFAFTSTVRHRLVAAGLTETPTYSFYSKELAESFDLADQPHAELANPLNPDQALLRRSLMPQLLTVAGKQSATRDSLRIFEVGRAFWPANRTMPEERTMLGIVDVRKVGLPASASAQPWQAGDPFLAVKGVVEAMCRSLGLHDVRYHGSTSTAARITVGTEAIGIIGSVRQKYADAVKLRKPAAFAEIDLSLLMEQPRHITKAQPLPVYPSVERDLAFALPHPVAHAELIREVRGVDPLILKVQGIDRFSLANGNRARLDAPPGSRAGVSITLRVTFQSPGTTLTSDDVQGIVERIAQRMDEAFSAEFRR